MANIDGKAVRILGAEGFPTGLADDQFRRLIEGSPDAICVHQHGRLLYVNDAGVRLMRAQSSDDLVGRLLTDFVARESLTPMEAGLAELREVGDCSPRYPAQMIRLDGTRLEVEVVIVKTLWCGEIAYQVITRDVSSRYAAETVLRYQAALINHVSDAIIATTATGLVTSWNPAAEAIYGWSVDEAYGRPISELVGGAADPVAIVASGGIVHSTHRAADGTPLDVRVSAAVMADGFVFVCCDMTALHRAEQHFEAVVGSMAEGVIVTDKAGCIKSINPAAVQIIGGGLEHLGGNFFEITSRFRFYDVDGVNIPPLQRPAMAVLRTGVPFYNQLYGFDRPDGQRVWLLSSARLLAPALPGQSDMLLSFADVTDQRKTADKVLFYATHDALTELPNRVSVLRRLKKALAAPDDADKLRAVLFIDIDDLKSINDTLGHTAGDELLRAAAACLRRVVDPDDVAGRLGGDEFVVLVFRDASREQLDEMIERLRRELQTPVAVGGTTTAIAASIGVIEVRRDEKRSADEILRDADLAMYEAKRARRTVDG
ncbi:sensor domain-containing protein [Mycolicibacterium agri]|uniref:sensor domain-containing protein n=1 Tax=Mycolicibacterium agri TaxID=36811 RepID=UPI0010553658|nr:GGDEF domain-containing protein [Mycolicibacterium agri]